MEEIKDKIVNNTFIPTEYEQKTALELIYKLINVLNLNADDIKDIVDNLALKEYKDNITTNRKLDETGNFTGSWHGITKPSESNEGLRVIVEGHTEEIKDVKTEVNKKPSSLEVRYIKDSIQMSDLSTEVKSAMTGGSVAIVGKNAVGLENIKVKAITPYTINGANPLNMVNGWNYNQIADNTGAIVTMSGVSVTNLIPVNSELKLSVSWNSASNFIAQYDGTGVFIGRLNGNVSSKVYTVLPNTKYVRCNVTSSEIDNFVIIQGEMENVPSGLKSKTQISWLEVGENNINTLPINKMNEVVHVKPNLFNISTISQNKVVGINDGLEVPLTRAFCTDYIPVKKGEQYTIYPCNTQNLYCLYDINKKFVSGHKGKAWDSLELQELNISNTIQHDGFIKINALDENKGIFIFENNKRISSKLTHNTPLKIDGLRIDFAQVENVKYEYPLNHLQGKEIHLFGDSLTHWDDKPYWNDESIWIKGYPSHIREKLNCTTVNHGISGATLGSGTPKSIYDRFRQIDLSKAYAVLITGGSNDLGQNVPIGEVGNRRDTVFNVNTYCGAIRDMIHRCYEQNKHIKIYLMSPIQMPRYDVSPYGDAMEQIAEMYGIPFLRADKKVPLNEGNLPMLTFDNVHPTTEGYNLWGPIVCSFLANF